MILAACLESLSWMIAATTGVLCVVVGQTIESLKQKHLTRQVREQSLRELEQCFYRVFDQAPDAIQLYAPDGTLRYTNRSGKTVWGVSHAALDGYNVLQDAQVLASGHLPSWQKVFAGEVVTFPPNLNKPVLNGPMGYTCWLEGSAYPIKTDTGAVQAVVLVTKDITIRKQAEFALQSTEEGLRHVNEVLEVKVAERTTALAQANAMLQATLESTAEGILVLDSQGKVISFNARLIKLWGISDSVLEALSNGQDGSILSFAAAQLKDPETFLHVTSESLSQLECETFDRLELKQGQVLECYSRPQRLNDRCIGKVLSFRDVTERRQAENALQRRAQQTTAVIAIQQEIAALSPDLEAVMALTIERVQALTHASGAVIEMVESDELVYRAANGVAAHHVGLRLKIATSLSGRCVESGEILCCNDTETDARVDLAACRRMNIRSMIVVPLSQPSGKAIGVLKAFSATPDAFTEQSVQTLQLLAGFLTNTLRLASQFQVKENLLAALQASEERYASVIAAMAEGVMLQNAEGKICASNASAERILGLSAEQMMGKASLDPHWQIIHEDGSPFPHDQRPAVVTLRTGEPCRSVVLGVAKPDRQLTWISINTQPLFHPHEALPYAVVTSFADITERRQMEEALRQSEAHNRAILQAVPDLLLRLRRDGFCLECLVPKGAQAESFVPIHQNVAEVLPPELWQRQLQDIEQAITTSELQVREHSFIKDGKLVYEEVRIAAINHDEALLIVRDISDRKQAEQKLELQDTIVKNMAEGICLVKEADRTIVYTNPKFEQMFGYEPGELIGQAVSVLNYEGEMSEAAATAQVILGNINAYGVYSYEIYNVKRDGTPFWCRATTSRFEHPEYGNVYVAVQADISDLKRAEAEARASLQIKADLVAKEASLQEKEVLLQEIHHRVKNNLQIVDGLLQMQSRRTDNRQAAAILRESQHRIKSIALVHEKLYRSDDLAKIDFSEYIRSLVASLFASYQVSSTSIIPVFKVEAIALDIDTAIPCGLIINELVSNALKYAFPDEALSCHEAVHNGEIQIELGAHAEAWLTLSVSDNGIGIPEHIDLTQTPSLGLKLVRSLATQLEGTVAIKRDQGTLIKVTFPSRSLS